MATLSYLIFLAPFLNWRMRTPNVLMLKQTKQSCENLLIART